MIKLKSLLEVLTQQKPVPRNFGASQHAYDWRTQAKGDHWKSRDGTWGARAQSGEVDYFSDEKQAQAFAQHTHTGQPGSYVSGQFGKGAVTEAKDETALQSKQHAANPMWKGKTRGEFDKSIHSNGSYWNRQSKGDTYQWGAKNATGEVKYFGKQSQAVQFADGKGAVTEADLYTRVPQRSREQQARIDQLTAQLQRNPADERVAKALRLAKAEERPMKSAVKEGIGSGSALSGIGAGSWAYPPKKKPSKKAPVAKKPVKEDAPTPDAAIVKAAKGLSEPAKKLLMVYGGHARNCRRPGGPECTCGWEDLYHALTGKWTN